ncbi:MAG TPA: hypothetical protein VGK73_17340 [Polyangiaceae bacterium]
MRRPAPSSFVVALFALGCGERASEPAASNWPADAPGPAGAGPGVRVFSGPAATLSAGTACTSEANAAGDRWCAFVGRASTGDENLFVVNVSQVMAGTPVSCGAPDPDPHCLLLTEQLGGSAADFHPSYFGGDTLVYYDRTLTPYVWRPGMEAGRLLADRTDTHDLAFCTPAPRGNAVACLALPLERTDSAIVTGELYAGAADGESEPLLSPIESVIVATRDDGQLPLRFGFGAFADGYIAWSSRVTPESAEVLELQHLDDPSQLLVAVDVHDWTITRDSRSWLWLQGANELGMGTLQIARFPDGADPVTLFTGVSDYEVDAGGSVVALTLDREVISIPDPVGAPDTQWLMDDDTAGILASSDAGQVAYMRRYASGAFQDLVVSELDGTGSCVLEATGNFSSSLNFAPDSESVLWARFEGDRYDAYHSRPAGCSSALLASDVVVLGWIGSGHAVFIDHYDPASDSGSLAFRKIGKNGEVHPDPATPIAEQADTYATWGPDFLLYTISTQTDADGLYVRAFGR